MRRVVIGFVVCALAVPVGAFLAFAVKSGSIGQQVLLSSLLTAGYSVPAVCLVGIPGYLVMRRHSLRPGAVVAFGAAAGALLSLPFFGAGWLGGVEWMGILIVLGAAHALLFRLVALWKNPQAGAPATGPSA